MPNRPDESEQDKGKDDLESVDQEIEALAGKCTVTFETEEVSPDRMRLLSIDELSGILQHLDKTRARIIEAIDDKLDFEFRRTLHPPNQN